MAMRKCVVSTSIGAEGLPLTENIDIVLADDPQAFAQQAIKLLRDDRQRNRIAEAACKHVVENWSWAKSAESLESALNQAINIGKSRQTKKPGAL